jgi:hypothetical protein
MKYSTRFRHDTPSPDAAFSKLRQLSRQVLLRCEKFRLAAWSEPCIVIALRFLPVALVGAERSTSMASAFQDFHAEDVDVRMCNGIAVLSMDTDTGRVVVSLSDDVLDRLILRMQMVAAQSSRPAAYTVQVAAE